MFDEYYSRHFPLSSIGRDNQYKLKYRTVLIAGMGGLGTVSSQLLSSIGVGKLKIIDFDVVEMTNLPRQTLYTTDDIGKAKVEIAEERLKRRNPFIKIEAHAMRIDALNAPSLLAGVDLVVDALDRFSSRRILHRAAYRLKIPYIFAGAIAESGNIMSFNHDEKTPCLECVIGDVNDNEEQSCEILGVNPIILHMVAGIQINEALKLLLDLPAELLGKMQMVDLYNSDFDKYVIKKKKECKLCGVKDNLEGGKPGETTKGQRAIGEHGNALVTSLCGRDTYIFDPKWEINWNFNKISDIISEEWETKVRGRNYITFSIDTINISLVDTGVATIRKAKTTKNAIQVMDKVFNMITNKLLKNTDSKI